MSRLRYVTVVVCLLALGACGGHRPQPMVPESEADIRWKSFQALSGRPYAPAVLSGSLRFGPVNDTRRVTYLMWGNGGDPLRLDVQAGVGTTVAKVRVSGGEVLVYLPEEGKAYAGLDEPDRALRTMGLPLPLGLADMAAFLEGHYAEALGSPQPQGFQAVADDDGIVYSIRTERGPSELTLSPQALPVRWKLPRGWDVRVSYDDATRLPRKVEGILPGGTSSAQPEKDSYRLILLIKDRQQPLGFPAGELELSLPAGTAIRSLDNE